VLNNVYFFRNQKTIHGGKPMNLSPLHDRVLVKRLEEEEVTKGGIIIPDSAKEKPIKGEIVAAGPGKTTDDGKTVPMSVKTGDKVLFNKYAGTEIKIVGVEYLVMREDDILATFNSSFPLKKSLPTEHNAFSRRLNNVCQRNQI